MRIFQLHKTSLCATWQTAAATTAFAWPTSGVRMQHALATRNRPHWNFSMGLHSANTFWARLGHASAARISQIKIQRYRYKYAKVSACLRICVCVCVCGNALEAKQNEQNRKQLLASKESNEIELEIEMKTGWLKAGRTAGGKEECRVCKEGAGGGRVAGSR